MEQVVAKLGALCMGLVLLGFVLLVVGGNLRKATDRRALAWVLVDEQGRRLGDRRFDGARPFSEGLAAVEVDGAWGWVDRDGRWVIEPRFREAGDFDESGHAVAHGGDAGAAGVVDRMGRWVVAPELWHVGPFVDGVAVASMHLGSRVARVGSHVPEIVPGLIRPDGTWVVPPARPRAADRWFDARGPADDRVVVKRGDGWRLLDAAGQLVARLDVELAEAPADGRVLAQRGGLWGFLDLEGRFVVPPRYADATSFSEGRATARGAEGWFVIDRDGAAVAGPFEALGAFSEGLVAMADAEGRWGFVDADGRQVIPATWERVGDEGFRDGRARVARAGSPGAEWAWIDRSGAVVSGWYAEVTPYGDGRAFARVAR